jgi:Transposase DDE domain
MVHAACYSGPTHYLKAVKATNTIDASVIAAKMSSTPDFNIYIFKVEIRPDREVLHATYAAPKLQDALNNLGDWTLEIVKRSDAAKGFILLPRRWVVERTFAWLNRNRRLPKDVEATIESAVSWLFIASVKLMSRRLVGA